MKRFFSLLVAVALLFCICTPVYAERPEQTVVSQTVEMLSENSCVIITVYEEASMARSSTKIGAKNYDYYLNGVCLWRFTVHGTFEYTGTSATCTASSYTYSLIDSAWTISNAGAYRVGASAIANATMTRTNGTVVYPSVTLTCSGTGVLS